MASRGIHFMALDNAKARLAATEEEYRRAVKLLDEAVKLGDLRESAEYDASKEIVNRVTKERDELLPVITMPVVKASDNISIIEEGSVVEVTVHSVTSTPIKPGTAEFEGLKGRPYAFKGVLMYGATLSVHELLEDKALSADTAVGRFILGKLPGDYSIDVPGGFANVTVNKLHSSTPLEGLYCDI